MRSVLSGKRSVCFLLSYTIKEFQGEIKNHPTAKLMVVPRDGVGIYGNGYILYTDEANARHLLQVMMKHDGYLSDDTPEEAIENGEALEYVDSDIKDFVESHYGSGSYDKAKSGQ